MSPSDRLRTKTYVLLAMMLIFGPVGDALLSKGMKQIGAVSHWSLEGALRLFWMAFTSGTIWLGIAFLLLFFVSYLLVLSWADFSYVLPASASGYAVVTLLAYLWLGERVTWARWTGVALICLGVLLVGRTEPRAGDMDPAGAGAPRL